jgi:E-phenylitaconyl-CoA hydratase
MPVLYDLQDNIATVTLNRPEAMNSLDPETLVELADIWQRVRDDNEVRVVILTGTGDRAFCTGSDLKKTMPPKESFAQLNFGKDTGGVGQIFTDKPVIAAINGYCLAGGLEISLRCDMRIAVEGAKFGLTETKIGSIPGGGGTQRLPRLVGMTNALRMLMTAEMIESDEALRIGLINEVVAREDLMPTCLGIAEKIASNAPLAVRAVKRLAYDGMEVSLQQGLAMERLTMGVLRDSKDRIEGRKAFAEKRKPVYRGE